MREDSGSRDQLAVFVYVLVFAVNIMVPIE